VLDIAVGREELLQRLTGRRVCRRCGAAYHLQYNPPAKAGRCNSCGGELIQRDDDTATTVARRLDVYNRQTAPLVAYYQGRGLVREIDGSQDIGAVTRSIGRALGGDWR